MPGKTAAPWEIPFSEPNDEPKTWPTVQKEQSERVAKMLGEHVLTIKEYAGAGSPKSGELAVETKAGPETLTLPAAGTANQLIGVSCKVASCKVQTAGGAFIYGKWLTLAAKTANVTLTEDMTAFFQSDGTNWILWGEVKSEQGYVEVRAEREKETEYTPNAARETVVTFDGIECFFVSATVGGVANVEVCASNGSFIVPAGFKFKAKAAGKYHTSYLPR
jgi:hypothetical protein